MSGLTQRDLTILGHYAQAGNRELYWNYLAQHSRDPRNEYRDGNDGYGRLALGVVRNDNAAGQVANSYADSRARSDGHRLSERDWQQFGVELMRNDLRQRQHYLRAGEPELALNLPVRAVQQAHDQAFRAAGISPDAWTPRRLLESARANGGEAAAERVWSNMLDDRGLGTLRGLRTTGDAIGNMGWPGVGYALGLTGTRVGTVFGSHPQTDPDQIGGPPLTYLYDRNTRGWASMTGGEATVIMPVRDPNKIAELNDARAVRLERQRMQDDFHPDDPNRGRPILKSRQTLAENDLPGPAPGAAPGRAPEVRLAAIDNEALAALDPRQTGHTQHGLYCQCRDGVHGLGGPLAPGVGPEGARMTARLFQLASDQGFGSVDAVMVGGHNAFIVQGDPTDPASRRAHVSLREALDTPVERSLQLAADNRAATPSEPAQDNQRSVARAMA